MYRLNDLNNNPLPSLVTESTTKREWQQKKQKIKASWLSYLGKVSYPPAKIEWTTIKETEKENYIEKLISYHSADGDYVPALLLIPRTLNKPRPGILALHPTDEKGKSDIATEYGRENRLYALELVNRGFIVLAPDTITAGERVKKGESPFHTKSFYEKHPDQTAVGKMLTDHMFGVSLLQQLPEVNADNIGTIGHSLGGYNAYFLAGLDERIKCVICSCGFSTFKGDPEKHRWGKREWFSHIPKLSEDINQGQVPFEFHEIASLVAPIPFFNWMSFNDHIFPHYEPAIESMKQIDDLYYWLDEKDKFIQLCGNNGHDFPEFIRKMAYEFLEVHLNANN
jgi:dienelactone hydrolase